MPRARHTVLATAIAAVTLGPTIPLAPAQAQQAEALIADRNPADAPSGAKEANQGVYVRDSAVAAEKLALGERMERLKEWDKAADVFQEILEKYPDRVVQSTTPGQANQYSSVAVAVQQRLAKWPEDGLRAYRNRYGSTAAELLATAGRDDYTTLNTVYQRYFVTDAGKTAGLRLIDLYLESGEFPAAAWLGDRLLQWHPTIAPEKPTLLYRVAVAYHLSGEKAKATDRLDELKSAAPNATGAVRGQDVNLVESLAKDLAAPVAIAQNLSAESWPVFMGDASRSRISTGLGRAGARPFSSIELARPSFNGLPQDTRQEWDAADKLDREKGLNIGIIPVVDRGEMFFQDGSRIYAVSLDSGTPLPGWSQQYPGSGQFVTNAALAPLSRRQQYTVTVTDKEVLAVVGQSGRAIQFPGQPAAQRGETRLVCLDRTTGREKWSRSPKDFPDQGNVRALGLGGSPLVVGDNIYVCGTGGKSAQFDDCYVFCLDRATGNHKWSAYVCSAATGQVLWGGESTPVADTVASPSYASGRLYVLTNLGAVAALDAYSGSVVWLDTYEREATDDPRMMRFGVPSPRQLSRPWSYNPAVVQNGRVYSLPADGKHLTVYDAGTGQTLKRINLTDVDNADTLVGVQGNNVIVSSDLKVYAFNWEAYDPSKFTPRSGAIYWASTFRTQSPIRGRSFLTADSVFVPTKERLFRIGLASGKIEDPYPPFTRGPWEDPEGPGNVVVTEDKVVLAGPNRVSVYTDLAVARAKLDKEVTASPNDANLRLRYADMLFVAGDLRAAMTKLDEAIGILGGEKNLAPGDARDRAFHTALTFAQKLSDAKTYAAENRDLINRLFDQAAAAGTSASQQVEYRVTRAKFAHNVGDFPTEARLYQEILADDAMRTVPLGTPDGSSTQQAAAVAEGAIDALVKQAGAQVYAPYERAAHDAMDFAKSAGKPDELLAIARKYPNASVASQSMFFAADAFEAAGQPRRATQVLRQLYFKYPTANKSAVLEAMARNYLAIPGHVDVAASRLSQGARVAGDAKLTKPLKLPDGKTLENVTFTQAADALKQLQSAAATRSLPDFKLPTAGSAGGKPLAATEPIPNVAALVPPLRDFARPDRAVVFTADGQVALYAPGSPQPLWMSKSLAAAARECAWVGPNVAVWNSQEVAILSGENGTVVWRTAVKTLPDIQVVKGDESTSAAAAAANAGENNVPDNGRVIIVNGRRVRIGPGPIRINQGVVIQGGVVVNPVANNNNGNGNAGEQLAQVRPAGDKLIASTNTGRLFAVDLDSGALAWQTRLTTDHPIERLLATDDFAVARFTDGVTVQLVALDAATGQVIRRYDNFRVDTNNIPVNQALSPDGTLVVSLPDRLMAKDLYEPGPANKWETPGQTNGAPLFVGADAADQLLAQDGKVLAVSDAGSFVRVLSLDTGEPARAKGEAGEVPVQLPTGARANTPVHLRLAGPRLYVFGPTSLKAFDLDNPLGSSGERIVYPDSNLRDLFVGSDYLLAVDDPGVARFIGNPDAPSTKARLLAYSRATVNGRESGRLDYDPTFPEPNGITTWQPATGGLFYLTGDSKLHFLKANTP